LSLVQVQLGLPTTKGIIIIMEEQTEKYLAQMLEGYESNLGPISAAMDQLKQQLDGLTEQREGMENGIAELKELLGLSEEGEAPAIEEVSDGSD
jgi:hypothetical protein